MFIWHLGQETSIPLCTPESSQARRRQDATKKYRRFAIIRCFKCENEPILVIKFLPRYSGEVFLGEFSLKFPKGIFYDRNDGFAFRINTRFLFDLNYDGGGQLKWVCFVRSIL